MGNIEPGSKAVLWSETRQPVQTWTTQMKGLINSVTFPGMVLDVKGTKPGLLRWSPTSRPQTGTGLWISWYQGGGDRPRNN